MTDVATHFDVPLAWGVPELGRRVLPEGGSVAVATSEDSRTEYDTAESDLAFAGATLARGTGADALWTLVVDGTTSSFPGSGRGIPADVRDLAFGLRAGSTLKIVRRVTGTRTEHQVRDADGTALGTIAVLHESVATPVAGAEVELAERQRVELSGWQGPFLDAAAKRLRKSGARAVDPVDALVEDASGTDDATVGSALVAFLAEQRREILRGDVALRLGDDAIHPTRVAIRRIRSALRVVDVADAGQVAAFDAELVWLSALLGDVRDRQVLRTHLHDAVADCLEAAAPARDEADDAVALRAAGEYLDQVLDAEESAARAALAAAMAGRRYAALLRTLRSWAVQPPLTAAADREQARLASYVARANRKLERRLATAGGDPEALHSARKAAKRARYVATFAGADAGKHGRAIAKRAKALQTHLGEHQDSVVAAEFLRRVAVAAPGTAAFGCGVLWTHEQNTAAKALRRARRTTG